MALHALARNPEQEGQVKLFIPWLSMFSRRPFRARGWARAPGRGLLRERPLQPTVHAPRPGPRLAAALPEGHTHARRAHGTCLRDGAHGVRDGAAQGVA